MMAAERKAVVPENDLIQFCQRFADLMDAGTPLATIFGVLAEREENINLRDVLEDIHRRIAEDG